jgi:hypothetical protein
VPWGRRKATIPGHILGFEMRFLQSKHSLFRALEKANSFNFSKFLASFRQNSIFFPFCADFPAPAAQS